jgi:sulfoxide reductase heme-binding subunit YedZ
MALQVDQRYRWLYKPAIFLGATIPLLLLIASAFGLAGRSLGADPIERVLHVLGKTALNLLLLTLLVTPLRLLGGWPHLLRVRRMLGLFAFSYALLHFLVYALLDLRLDLAHLTADVIKRPYITIGFCALLILVPLAATSTNAMMRRLGRRWTALHRWVYVAASLAVWHYYWQVKKDVREPLVYAGILAALLGYRYWVRRRQPPARLAA